LLALPIEEIDEPSEAVDDEPEDQRSGTSDEERREQKGPECYERANDQRADEPWCGPSCEVTDRREAEVRCR
jgi:hypothetical protein